MALSFNGKLERDKRVSSNPWENFLASRHVHFFTLIYLPISTFYLAIISSSFSRRTQGIYFLFKSRGVGGSTPVAIHKLIEIAREALRKQQNRASEFSGKNVYFVYTSPPPAPPLEKVCFAFAN